MQVRAINNNQLNFGTVKETTKGNQYETSNEGKKIYPIVAIATAGISTAILLKTGALERLYSEEIKELPLKSGTKTLIGGISVAAAALGGFIWGAVIDVVANGRRRKDADKFAETGKKPTETNKGKLICGAIGLAFGGITYAIMKGIENISEFSAGLNNFSNMFVPPEDIKGIKKTINPPNTIAKEIGFKYPKALKYSAMLASVISWTIVGAIYDHAVNKFRNGLAHKADKSAKMNKVESDIDTKIDEKIAKAMAAKSERTKNTPEEN